MNGFEAWLGCFFFGFFFGWQSCSTDRVRLDRSIECHVNYGGTAEEHSQIKNSQHVPHHMQISLPLFSYTASPFFFFFFFHGHTDQPRDTNRTVVTPSVFTQSCLLARMKWSHWHIRWMDDRWWHRTADRHLHQENKPMDMSASTEMTNKQAWTSWWSYLKHTLTDEGTIASKVQLLFVTTYSPNLTWARC